MAMSDAPSPVASSTTNSPSPSPPPYHDHAHQSSISIPERYQQPIIIKDLNPNPLEPGDTWYLVSRKWYRRWQVSCMNPNELAKDDDPVDESQVGEIDNSDIVDETVPGGLKRPVTEGVDIELLSEQAYGVLKSWYGAKSPEFPRTVISTSSLANSARIEFYPPSFSLLLVLPSTSTTNTPLPTHETTPSISLSSSSPYSLLESQAATQFNLHRPVRFWRLPLPSPSTSTLPPPPAESEGPSYIFSDTLLGYISSGQADLIDTSALGSNNVTLAEATLTDEVTRLAVEPQLESTGEWIVTPPPPPPSTSQSSTDSAPTVPLFGSQYFGTHSTPTTHPTGILPTTINVLQPKYGAGAGAGGGGAVVKPKDTTGTGLLSGGGGIKGVFGALTRSKVQAKGQMGLTGLQNLGNTCFMNSALQCMSNTKELQEYFISGVYKSEINRTNPLGMKGQVAEAFGQLLERLWSTTNTSIAPREFKQALAKFAPSFSGYGQQDTQELLAFLLDGVHEDLNRIKKKPATEAPDWEGGGDRELVELARTCWEQYRSRNDSVIVDLFQGQYRSTVVCPDCDKISITFDPFMYVTTNLPINRSWDGKVYVVPADPSRPRYELEIQSPKNATIKQVKGIIGSLVNIDPKLLFVVEEWKHKLYKAWHDDDLISEVNTKQDTLLFHELAVPIPQLKPRFYGKNKPPSQPVPTDLEAPITIVVFHVHRKSRTGATRRLMGVSSSSYDNEEFGSPFFVTLSREEACSPSAIYKAMVRQYARCSKRGEEMIEFAQDDVDAEEAPGEEEEEAVPAAASSESVVATGGVSGAPLTPPPEEADTTMEVDEPEASTSALLPPPVQAPPKYESTVEMPRPDASGSEPATVAPPLTTASAPAAAKEPKRLFAMKVGKVRSSKFPLESQASDWNTVPLEARREASVQPTASTSTAVTPFTTSAADSSDEDELPVNPNHVGGRFKPTASVVPVPDDEPAIDPSLSSEPSSPASATPLVGTGDYILAEWDHAAMAHFFGRDADGEDQSLWEVTTNLVDPALEATRAKRGEKRKISLEDCLNEFTKEERLGEEDTWYCPVCKKHQQATKKVEIWKAPDIFVFALKRFSSSRYSRDKLDDFVDFPVEGFNLESFVEGDKVERRLNIAQGGSDEDAEPLIYDLYAVDNHYGGLGGGHYTAFAKNPENSQWYEFDDGRVSPISDPENRVKTKAAYLLFYRRRTARPIGAKTRELVDSAIQSRNASASNSDAGDLTTGDRPVSSLGQVSFSAAEEENGGMSTDYNEDADGDLTDRFMPGGFFNHNPSFSGRASPVVSDAGAEPGSPSAVEVWTNSQWDSSAATPEPVDVNIDDELDAQVPPIQLSTAPMDDLE